MRKSEDAGEIWNLSRDVCWQTWLSLLEVILKLFCGKGWLELKSILWVIRLWLYLHSCPKELSFQAFPCPFQSLLFTKSGQPEKSSSKNIT